MTRTQLLQDLKAFSEECLKDFLLPVKRQKTDTTERIKSPDVYLMRMPDSNSAAEKAPCLLIQIVGGMDAQSQGQKVSSSVSVRIVFMVYNQDEQEGGLALLELMERYRIALLKMVVLNNQYVLDLENGIETTVYPDNTAPYYIGEINTNWHIPPVNREVREYL